MKPNPDPFPKLGLNCSQNHRWQPSRAKSTDQLWGGLSVGSSLPQWKLLVTLASFSANEELDWRWSIWHPLLVPTMTLTHNRRVHSKYDFLSSSSFLPITISPYAPQITLIRQLMDSHPRLQYPLKKCGEFQAHLVTTAAAALLKPHPSPSSRGLLTSHSLPWPGLPLRQLPQKLPPIRTVLVHQTLWRGSAGQSSVQVLRPKRFHGTAGRLKLKGTKLIEFDRLPLTDGDAEAQIGLCMRSGLVTTRTEVYWLKGQS